MRKSGVHNFPAINRVIYGKAASEALNEEAGRLNAKRVFLLASRTLNTKTDEIEKIRNALGDKHVATLTELHSIQRAGKLPRLHVRQKTQKPT
jgi:maleylacetate reductase